MANGKLEIGCMLVIHTKLIEQNDGVDCIQSCVAEYATIAAQQVGLDVMELFEGVARRHDFDLVNASPDTVALAAIKLANGVIGVPEEGKTN